MRAKALFVSVTATLCLFGIAWPATSSPAADACGLLTQAEVGAALGTSVGAGQYPIASSRASCEWVNGKKRVTLEILQQIGSATPAERFNTVKTPGVPGITKTPARGVGDDAVYVMTGRSGTSLYVKKGSSVIRLQVFGFPVDQTKTMEMTLAQEAVAKL